MIADTQEKKIPIDIRVTDTGSSPNSVLLVGSNGDLFTEGLAHNGKVLLFSASEARPDLIRRYWYHVDAFGHSRRYLNWNPWLYEGESLADLCYAIPEVNTEDCQRAGIVELEAKYKVEDIDFVRRALARNAAVTSEEVLQRDEYFDTPDRTLDSQDFVVRIRKSRSATEIGMKGARFRTPTGEYSRVELEFTAASEQQVRDQIRMQGLERTWFFEKRRTEFRWSDTDASVFLDEIPEIGYFVEIEGSLDEIHMIEQHLTAGLHMKINRNYKELFVESRNARGEGPSQIEGAQFSNANFK
ncbi:MAG: class IV adenylate cyclase [Planctomycetales bacterium]|nr:class IV adenylate cyclase [Planctomycetales bacterium]